MIRLSTERDLRIKDLARFVEPVEICDAEGKLLGLFVPANLERGKQLYAKLAKDLDRTEIARRISEEKPGSGWQEFLKRTKEATTSEHDGGTPTPASPVTEGGECVTP